MSLLERWDDSQKKTAKRILGLFAAVLCIFVLITLVSYLIHWKEDQSLLTAPEYFGREIAVHNEAGKSGFALGHLLVDELFGLGSFALVIILGAVSTRLMFGKGKGSLLKTKLVALTGAFIASLIFSMFSDLGGRCGDFVTEWAENLVGPYVTPLLIFVLMICWLSLSSRRFCVWIASLGKKSEKIDMTEFETALGDDGDFPLESSEPFDIEICEENIAPAAVGESGHMVDGTVEKKTESPETGDELDSGMEIIRGKELSTKVDKPLPRIDMRKEEVPDFKFFSLDILDNHSYGKQEVSNEELQRNNNKIRASLANYKIQVKDVKAVVGPTVTLYKVYQADGVRIAEIKRLQDDIAMSLNARGVRIVTLSDSVGIEVANDNPSIVPLKVLLNDSLYRDCKAELPVAMGYTITQKVKVFDLADTPHLLIAGATKQGKSVGLNVIVSSLLYAKHPSELKLVFIDPKMVEFSSYGKLLNHYLAVLPDAADEREEMMNSIVKKPKDAEKILRSLCMEMDDRYELMSKAYVNNVKLYNEKYKDRHLLPTDGHKYMPYLVVIIDEYADLTMSTGGSPEAKSLSRSIQGSIIRLAQKGRAAGIHVILATQRPSVDVISGIIKANFPTRIAFRVTSRVDSTTILDNPGAEKLIGKGDMLFYSGVEMERVQCGYVSNDEINSITEFIGSQKGYRKSYNTPYYLPDPSPAEGENGGMVDMSDLDERFEEAARLVVTTQRGSTSDLQRRLGMGYAKAGRVMDQLEAAGIVSPQEGSKPRQVLVSDLNALEEILRSFIRQ